QLAQEARGEVADSRKQLTADINAFSQHSGQLLKQERQQQRQALRQRQVALKRKMKRVEARIQYTRNAVTQRLDKQVGDVLQTVAGQQDCGIVLKRDSVAWSAQEHDLTAAVVAALNDKIDMINFGLLQ